MGEFANRIATLQAASQYEARARTRTELNESWTLIPFHVDPSWYERYWWDDSAPRNPGIFAFFRRILSQQRTTGRQDVRPDHRIPHSLSTRVARPGVAP
jgi:hypothetical protein